MQTPLTPGVYVREAPGGARSIEAAPTAVTIFVGETERGPSEPTAITSAAQFRRIFGGFVAPGDAKARLFMPYAINGFFGNGGPRAWVLRLGAKTTDKHAELEVEKVGTPATKATLRSIEPGAWSNGISVKIETVRGDAGRFDLTVSYKHPDEVGEPIVERFFGLSPDPQDPQFMLEQIGRSSLVRWVAEDGVEPFTPKAVDGKLSGGTGGDTAVAHSDYQAALTALDGIDDAALIVCASRSLVREDVDARTHTDLINAVRAYVENDRHRPQRDLFLVADAPRSGGKVGEAVNAARNSITPSDHMALYWPHIIVGDPAGKGRNPSITIPAAGHIAGLYGKTDGRRGVQKAAAGVEAALSGATGLDAHILDIDQERMNPYGLNAIRAIPGAGRVLWGARTLRPTTEWRYINVRRTAIFLRRSIHRGIQWAVFEGNDERLWSALTDTVEAFMEAQFRNGMFAGETSDAAYFVKCDADTTTPDDQAAGVVNMSVGFAPLRPAEFVLVTLSQKTAN